MALRFCDSFDHYIHADLLSKWSTSPNRIDRISIDTGGRTGTYRLHMQGSDGPQLVKTLDSQPTWIIGTAISFPTIPQVDVFLAVMDAGSLQCEVRMNSSGNLLITRNGTLLVTGTRVLQSNVWYYVEFAVTIADAGGTATVRIDGIQDSTFTGDTQSTANATANQIRLGGTARCYHDDLYICDGTGSAPNNTFLGDSRVEVIMPSANGNSSVLVGSDGNSTDNYLLVDEAAQDGDTTYVESATVGNKDTYTYGNLVPTAGTVYGLQILPWAKKTDAGARSIATVARLAGTEVDGANKTLSTSYTYVSDIRETKPGGGAWSITNVNDAEFGVKVTV